ncbi:erythromycin esterase-like protein [Arthrobacter sp. CAN_A6]
MKDPTGVRSAALPLRGAADHCSSSTAARPAGPAAAVGSAPSASCTTPTPGRRGNYVPTVLNRRYDAFLWIDRTTPLEPLHEGRTS